MVGSNDEPKLLVLALKPFYDFVIPLSWFVVRAAAGWNLLVHSWGKITVGPASGFLKASVDIGFTPPDPWFWTALFTTRFFAAAAAIELLIITAIYWHNGFSWLRQPYGYGYRRTYYGYGGYYPRYRYAGSYPYRRHNYRYGGYYPNRGYAYR
jgi:uncharacterized membrane protein YphA (DoxX/SURF4 family)